MLDLKFVFGDDWQGLYINDKLWMQQHRIEHSDLIDAINEYLPITKIEYNVYAVDIEWLEEVGRFPIDFKDVKLYE